MSAHVRISLECRGREEVVWLSDMPVIQADLFGVQRAAGDAFTAFIVNLARDEQRSGAVSRWLVGEDVSGT